MGWLPRAALEIVSSEHLSAHKWDGKWRRDSEAEIVIKSDSDAVYATWGGSDPHRVKTGAINTGELEGTSRPRGRLLAIGYDPDRSGFPPSEEAAECAAKLELYDRYLIVEDNERCAGLNVTFSGLYVRANSN
jgi:hypothetical protein